MSEQPNLNNSCSILPSWEMDPETLIHCLKAQEHLLENHIKMAEEGAISEPCIDCRRKDLAMVKSMIQCVESMVKDAKRLSEKLNRVQEIEKDHRSLSESYATQYAFLRDAIHRNGNMKTTKENVDVVIVEIRDCDEAFHRFRAIIHGFDK